jgi:8-oxo-dGTP pyrophosphatase MutT (NUDIX family)
LRQPYYGKVGRLTGKVHFGEALKEAAARELYEETGLRAKTFTLEEIYRKIRKREDGTFVQDVVFFIFFVTNFSGKLIAKTPFQENFWATEKNLRNKKKYDLYDDFRFDFSSKPKRLTIRENIAIAEGF